MSERPRVMTPLANTLLSRLGGCVTWPNVCGSPARVGPVWLV